MCKLGLLKPTCAEAILNNMLPDVLCFSRAPAANCLEKRSWLWLTGHHWTKTENSSVDQEKLELPQVEEQQEETISSELKLKQELVDLPLCSADEESNKSENPTVDWKSEEPLHESEVNIQVITSVVSEAVIDLSHYHSVSQSQRLGEDRFKNSKSTRPKQKEQNSSFHKSQTDQNQNASIPKSNISLTKNRHCKKFKPESKVLKHRTSHVSRNQHVGKTPESSSQTVLQQKTIDTGKKPFVCPTCGKSF